MQRRSPCFTLNRRDEHLAHPFALTPLILNPGGGFDGVEIRLPGRIPYVPTVLEFVQNPIQPPMSVRIVRCTQIDLDSQRPYAFERLARRMARISS